MGDRLAIEYRLADGDLAGALATAGTVPRRSAETDPRYLWPLLASAMRVHAEARSAGLPPSSGNPNQLLEALAARAAAAPARGPVEQAYAATFAAELTRASGRPDRAAWDKAAAAWEAIGQPYPLAYALLRAAAASGNRDAAAAPPAEGGGACQPPWRSAAAAADHPGGPPGADRAPVSRHRPGRPGDAVRADRP